MIRMSSTCADDIGARERSRDVYVASKLKCTVPSIQGNLLSIKRKGEAYRAPVG
jgi:hypothetical protein